MLGTDNDVHVIVSFRAISLSVNLMKSQPEPIHRYLHAGGTLTRLQQHNQRLQRLRDDVRRCLPEALARHIVACSLNDSQLILYAESASRATALRLTAQKLLQKLHQDHGLGQIKAVRVRITTPPRSLQSRTASPRALASGTAKLLNELAETAIDPAIRKILRRLARRDRNNNSV
jgi:hypothetical protein